MLFFFRGYRVEGGGDRGKEGRRARQHGHLLHGQGAAACPSVSLLSSSSRTRTRTRNTSLEARDDVHFTIGPYAEGEGFEASSPVRWHALAVRPGKPYSATIRLCETTARRTNEEQPRMRRLAHGRTGLHFRQGALVRSPHPRKVCFHRIA